MRKTSRQLTILLASFIMAAVTISPVTGENSHAPINAAPVPPVYLPLVLKSSLSPSSHWTVELSNPTLVANAPNVPIYPWFPDGHISFLPDGSGQWMMFWAEFESYRSLGSSPYPESQTTLSPATKVLGGRGGSGWDNGGSWLFSVFRLADNRLVGFYHAEDIWTVSSPAWKSIAVTYSDDNGVTWSPGKQIITTWKVKPATPVWGGAGDQSVIWDSEHQRWVCFYQEQVDNGEAQIHVAVSYDPNGGVGSWYKWDGSGFSSTPGLGGKGKALPAFIGHEGANPSVHWNTYLNKWVMVYGGWDNVIYISSSIDLLNWDTPKLLIGSDQGGHAWYPTIIGDAGDLLAGQMARLYYADIAGDYSSRKFYMRSMVFKRTD